MENEMIKFIITASLLVGGLVTICIAIGIGSANVCYDDPLIQNTLVSRLFGLGAIGVSQMLVGVWSYIKL